MAQNIRLKRSAVPGRVPDANQVELGELALNTFDGKLYLKKDNGTESIIDVGESASFATSASFASTALFATSASFASTASFVLTASFASTASFVLTASFASTASSVNRLNQNVSISGSLTVTGSTNFAGTLSTNTDILIFTGSLLTSGSIVSTGSLNILGGVTGSLLGTASYATQALTASNATTASSADNFLVRGTLTAQTIVAQVITSSTEFITGSTKFGSLLSDNHQFTGSVSVTGSLTINGRNYINDSSSFESRITTSSGSFASFSGSYVTESSSFSSRITTNSSSISSLSSSFTTFSGSFNTGSFTGSFTGSLLGTASYATQALTASFATTASYALQTGKEAIVTSPGGIYYIDGVAKPVLTLTPGKTYRFNTAAVDSPHPFKFSLSPNGPTQYTYGVTSGSGYIEINVDYNTSSSLYYYCTIHSGMGNAVNTLRDENLIHNSQTSSMSVASASFATTASYVLNAQSASYWSGSIINAATASYILNAQSASYVENAQTASYVLQAVSASFATTASYALISTNPITVTSPGGIYYINGVANPALTFVPGQNYRFDTSNVDVSHPFKFSLSPNGPTQYTYGITSGSGFIEINVDYNTSSSLYYYCTVHNGMGNAANTLRDENLIHNSQTSSLSVASASYAATASFVAGVSNGTASLANTASYAVSSSFAATASSADNFTVRGTLTAQTINVQTITSSIDFVTGSSRFGSTTNNTHQFTGSVSTSGSLQVNGSNAILTNQTSSMSVSSASYALTASYALISTEPIVVTSPGGIYYINGVAKPVLTLVPGQNYRFDTSAVDSPHPFKFSLSPNGPTQYTYGVTSGSGYIEINVDYNTSSSLYYYCTIHSGMGNAVNTLRDENLIHNSQTSSLNVASASFAATASSADNLTVRGTLTAQTINVQTITSSIEFVTGSTRNGSLLANTHQFTGSVLMTGSLNVTSGITGSLLGTASYATNALTASYISGSGEGVGFPFSGSAIITGSFLVSQSFVDFTQATYVTGSFTGSFNGIASTASNTPNAIVTASVNASTITFTKGDNTTFNITVAQSGSTQSASFATNATSASHALNANTASFTINATSALTASNTPNAIVTASANASTITFTKGDNSTFNVTLAQSGSVESSSFAANANSASHALTANTASFAFSAISSSFASNSISSSFALNANTASFTQTSSYSSYALIAGNAPGMTVTMSQATPATTWSFVHNLNTRNPLLQVYDSTNSQIIPYAVIGSDPSVAIIYFDTAESGFAVASNGGALTVSGSTSRLDQTVAAATWSFSHNLATKYPTFEIYNDNDNVIIPAGIHAVSNMVAEIYFSYPSTGIAIATFSGVSGATFATSSYAYDFNVANTLTIDQTLTDYHTVTSSIVGSNNIFSKATGSYSSAFFKYSVTKGSNSRAGEVMAAWVAGSIQFTDNSTLDIGDTSGVTATAIIAASSVQFNITTADSAWTLKTLATFM